MKSNSNDKIYTNYKNKQFEVALMQIISQTISFQTWQCCAGTGEQETETCTLGEEPDVIWVASLKYWMQEQQLLRTAQLEENAFESFWILQLQGEKAMDKWVNVHPRNAHFRTITLTITFISESLANSRLGSSLPSAKCPGLLPPGACSSALALGSCMSAHASGRSFPPTVCAYKQQTCLW